MQTHSHISQQPLWQPSPPDFIRQRGTAICSRGWGNRCPTARSARCTCSCNGRNHGNPKADKSRLDLTTAEATSRALLPMNKEKDIVCRRDPYGPVFNVDHAIVLHSKTGMDWGYGGSGPADFALNILAIFAGPLFARQHYQDFKNDFISVLPREGGMIRGVVVRAWIADRGRETASAAS